MIETGVSFNEIHSYRDLNLILSRVEVAPASPKTVYVDIPGADGSLDLSEALGEIKFSDRTLKFTFTMHPGGDLSESAWEAKKTQVSNRLNGLACQITLDKDPGYYWQGGRVPIHQAAPAICGLRRGEAVQTQAEGDGGLHRHLLRWYNGHPQKLPAVCVPHCQLYQ